MDEKKFWERVAEIFGDKSLAKRKKVSESWMTGEAKIVVKKAF